MDQAIPGTYDALLDAPQPPWAKRTDGEVVRWSGIDLTTTYPGTTASLQWETGEGGGDAHRDRLGGAGQSATCDRDCKLHSEAIHDALKLLVHHYSIPDRFLGERAGGVWNPANVHDLLAWNVRPATGIPWPVGGPTDDFRHLPMAATRHNGELLRICQQHSHAPFPILSVADLLRTDLKLLCRFKASLDGNPDSNSPYIRQYVPHCIQDPMLLQIILYTSSCFLNETGHAPRTVMMAHKGEAIRMLNEHLRSGPRQTSDSAIAGVVQLIVDEWYWGETQDLRAHLRGLREMIRLRGGFAQLGMSGFLAKNAITYVSFHLEASSPTLSVVKKRAGALRLSGPGLAVLGPETRSGLLGQLPARKADNGRSSDADHRQSRCSHRLSARGPALSPERSRV
jgi:hypothetical protein